ncbi:MAG: phosphoadenosine phosphosulfate reductase family protein [Crocinitomicaceae bacterium]|nr:phosphoadenosine phosphosulfate reductase family protein [Crocinitomicaceae bacterium]
MDVTNVNKLLNNQSPRERVEWAISQAKNPVLTTNFRPYESAIIHLVTAVKPDIKVIWCDTGYNTPQTYRHAKEIIDQLKLNIAIYVPQLSAAYRDVILGIPEVDTPAHDEFTRQVKLEPFQRAMAEHQPDLWFTNLRKGQTAFRDSIDVVSQGKDGIIKVSPFYDFSDEQLDKYLVENNLSTEHKYFDPTKVLSNRECGLHA